MSQLLPITRHTTKLTLAIIVIVVFSLSYVIGNEKSFSFIHGQTYRETKEALLEKGWDVYLPPTPPEAAERIVIDTDYPEITDCGAGIDMICVAYFKRGSAIHHLNLQIGGRLRYSEWTVVGDE
jgi:hypothetical protein